MLAGHEKLNFSGNAIVSPADSDSSFAVPKQDIVPKKVP